MPKLDPDKARAADKVAIGLAKKLGGEPDVYIGTARKIVRGELEEKSFLAGAAAIAGASTGGDPFTLDAKQPRSRGSMDPFTSDPRIPTGKSAAEIKAFSRKTWGVPMSDQASIWWEKLLGSEYEAGDQKQTEKGTARASVHAESGSDLYLTAMQAQAAALHPQWADAINAGAPPDALLDGYRAVAETELGYKPEEDSELFWSAPKEAYADREAFGLYLRTLPEWDEGPKAHEQAERLHAMLRSPTVEDSTGVVDA